MSLGRNRIDFRRNYRSFSEADQEKRALPETHLVTLVTTFPTSFNAPGKLTVGISDY